MNYAGLTWTRHRPWQNAIAGNTTRARTRVFCAAALVFCCAGASQAATVAQAYPTKPIRIIVTNGPGSGPDIFSRVIGAKLTEAWGQQIVIDNRAGANGIIGNEIGARAAPDGYTLLMVTLQAVLVTAMNDKLTYDIVADFAPISLLGSTPFIMVAHPSVKAASVRELIVLANTRPGELQYGSTGPGSPSHVAIEIFKSMTGVNLFHVPYKAVVPAISDTLANQVQLTLQAVPALLPIIRSGKLKALGVTSPQRTALAPDLPAIAETLPGYEFMGWYGLFAPAGTARDILDKLNAALNAALKTAEFRDRLTALGAEPLGTTPREFAAHIAAEVGKMRKATQAAGVRTEQ